MFDKRFFAIFIIISSIQRIACAKNKSIPDDRIYNGFDTEAKFLVTLRVFNQYVCGGALISPKCVLTAAHCVPKSIAYAMRVHGNCVSRMICAAAQSISEIQFGPYFEPYGMDAAILILSNSMINENISTIDIDYTKLNVADNITVLGLGNADTLKERTAFPVQGINATVISRHECQRHFRMKSVEYCAKGIESEQDACAGDSGGPAVRNGKLVGIVSAGAVCPSNYPGLYVDLSKAKSKSFLKRVISAHCSD